MATKSEILSFILMNSQLFEEMDLANFLCSQGSQPTPQPEPKETPPVKKIIKSNPSENLHVPLRSRYCLLFSQRDDAILFQSLCTEFIKNVPIYLEDRCHSALVLPIQPITQVYFKYVSDTSYDSKHGFPAEILVTKQVMLLIWLPLITYNNIEINLLDEGLNVVSTNIKGTAPMNIVSTLKFTRDKMMGIEVKLRFKISSGKNSKKYRVAVVHNCDDFTEILYIGPVFEVLRATCSPNSKK